MLRIEIETYFIPSYVTFKCVILQYYIQFHDVVPGILYMLLFYHSASFLTLHAY